MLEQTGQPTMVFIHENSKKGKKTENTLQVWTNCIFFGEKIYSLFEIVNVPVHCDVRPQTSVDTGIDFQWQVPPESIRFIVQPWSVVTWPFYYAMLLAIRLSEQSLHTHSPSREETIEQRPSYLTYDYEMELLYEYDLEFCAQIIHPPKQTKT